MAVRARLNDEGRVEPRQLAALDIQRIIEKDYHTTMDLGVLSPVTDIYYNRRKTFYDNLASFYNNDKSRWGWISYFVPYRFEKVFQDDKDVLAKLEDVNETIWWANYSTRVAENGGRPVEDNSHWWWS